MAGYPLVALYRSLISVKLDGESIGLNWDPVQIADFVAFFSKCNVLRYFERLELRHAVSVKYALSDEQ